MTKRLRWCVKTLPDRDRVMFYVSPEPNTGCWLWMGSTDGSYGTAYLNGRKQKAHRVVWELIRGPVLPGRELDHLCRVRCCVNPDHLEPVSHRENVLRGTAVSAMWAKRTKCSRGHELDGLTTRRGRKMRYCKTCDHARRKTAS